MNTTLKFGAGAAALFALALLAAIAMERSEPRGWTAQPRPVPPEVRIPDDFLDGVQTPLPPAPTGATELAFTTLSQNADAMESRRRGAFAVVGLQSGMRLFGGPQDAGPIDFSKQMAIVVQAGEKPSTGYEIEIRQIYELPATLEVLVVETTPTGAVGMAMTYPSHLVVLERVDKPINVRILDAPSIPTVEPPGERPGPQPIPLRFAPIGSVPAPVGARTTVAGTEAQWAALWASLGAAPRPPVDFARDVVVVVVGGQNLRLHTLAYDPPDKRLHLRGAPRPGGPLTAHLIRIPRFDRIEQALGKIKGIDVVLDGQEPVRIWRPWPKPETYRKR